MGDGWLAEVAVSGCRVAALNVFAPKVCGRLVFWMETTGEGAAAEGWRSNQELQRKKKNEEVRRGNKDDGTQTKKIQMWT